MQGFYCKYISFKNSVDIFQRIEISESIYDGVVEPSYEKPNGEYVNHDRISRKMIEESASSNTHSNMGETSVKRRKRYVDPPKDRSKLTCLIRGHGNL